MLIMSFQIVMQSRPWKNKSWKYRVHTLSSLEEEIKRNGEEWTHSERDCQSRRWRKRIKWCGWKMRIKLKRQDKWKWKNGKDAASKWPMKWDLFTVFPCILKGNECNKFITIKGKRVNVKELFEKVNTEQASQMWLIVLRKKKSK